MLVLGGLTVMAGYMAASATAVLPQQAPVRYDRSARGFTAYAQPPQTSIIPFTPLPSGTNGSNGNNPAAISSTTTNWAGYVSDSGAAYTSISGSWKVPSVSASSGLPAANATWIGIGGNNSNDLIQVGTQNIVSSGQVATSAFYEELPNVSTTVPGVTVHAGDTITASLQKTSSGQWAITIRDVTNGESYSTTVTYNSSESSAEWIEEAPSVNNSIIPLDSFGSVTFTGATTTQNGSAVSIANSSPQAITMDTATGQALTTTSGINGGGSFTVTRTNVSSSDTFGNYGTTPSGLRHHDYDPGYYTAPGSTGNNTPGAVMLSQSPAYYTPPTRHHWWR